MSASQFIRHQNYCTKSKKLKVSTSLVRVQARKDHLDMRLSINKHFSTRVPTLFCPMCYSSFRSDITRYVVSKFYARKYVRDTPYAVLLEEILREEGA